MTGRRCDDVPFGDLPDSCDRPGSYWKYLDREDPAKPMQVNENGNLTGTVWGFCAPIGGIGTLRLHTVREHEDGTITVAPGDGSSNSILFTGSHGRQWHGYIDRGVWQEA